jgi:hypothetical protein
MVIGLLNNLGAAEERLQPGNSVGIEIRVVLMEIEQRFGQLLATVRLFSGKQLTCTCQGWGQYLFGFLDAQCPALLLGLENFIGRGA